MKNIKSNLKKSDVEYLAARCGDVMINPRGLFVIDIVQSMTDSQIILARLGLQLAYRSYFATKRVKFSSWNLKNDLCLSMYLLFIIFIDCHD